MSILYLLEVEGVIKDIQGHCPAGEGCPPEICGLTQDPETGNFTIETKK